MNDENREDRHRATNGNLFVNNTYYICIRDNVFKNASSEICGRQPLKDVLPKAYHTPFKGCLLQRPEFFIYFSRIYALLWSLQVKSQISQMSSLPEMVRSKCHFAIYAFFCILKSNMVFEREFIWTFRISTYIIKVPLSLSIEPHRLFCPEIHPFKTAARWNFKNIERKSYCFV